MKSFFSFRILLLSGLVLIPAQSFAEAQEPLIKKTQNGSVFKKVSEEELKVIAKNKKVDPEKFAKVLGEAWEDPSGMIWGDAKKTDGFPSDTDHEEAMTYCYDNGAEGPSGYLEEQNGKNGFPNQDSDFVRLRKYMGAKAPVWGFEKPIGYSPQVLPNLKWFWLWSTSVNPNDTSTVQIFGGSDGRIGPTYRIYKSFQVRCVVRR
jgi:hypothetical protein